LPTGSDSAANRPTCPAWTATPFCGGSTSLRARGLTTGTIRTRWRGLRRFTNWLLAEDIIDTDPLAGIVIDKPEPPPVPIR
jgi:site-specific recombinase XerC